MDLSMEASEVPEWEINHHLFEDLNVSKNTVDGSEIRRSPVTCGDCKTKKDLDKFTGKNITCNACLEKGRTGSTETLTTYIIEVDT